MACAAPLCLLWLLEGFSRGDAGSVPVWAVSQPGLFAINYALYAAPCLLLCLVPSRRARLCSLLGAGPAVRSAWHCEPLQDLLPHGTAAVFRCGPAGGRVAGSRGLALDIDFVEIFTVAGIFAALVIAAVLWMRGRSRCGALLPLLGLL